MPLSPNNLDKHIGFRLKMRRFMVNMTQEQLAEKIGITCQQVQKYEKGKNRISASSLYAIATILDVEVGYFYDGYHEDMILKEDILTYINDTI